MYISDNSKVVAKFFLDSNVTTVILPTTSLESVLNAKNNCCAVVTHDKWPLYTYLHSKN